MSDRQLQLQADGRRRSVAAVDLLEWVYRDQKAHVVYDQAGGDRWVYGARSSACGCLAVERLALAGCRIDGGGYAAGVLHADAEAVHEFVLGLWGPVRNAILVNAKGGTLPEWEADPVRVEPSWKHAELTDPSKPGLAAKWAEGLPARGSYRVEYDRNRNPLYCPVEIWGGVPAVVEAMRRQYELWFAGVEAVGRHFGANPERLIRHHVAELGAVARPWDTPPAELHAVAQSAYPKVFDKTKKG